MTMIDRVTFPQSAFSMSKFAAGFWRLKEWGLSDQALAQMIERLVSLGVTTMDHAMVYQSEALFGRALNQSPELKTQVEIVSKCGIRAPNFGALGAQTTTFYDSSAAHIRASVEASLQNLQVAALDLLLIHRPDYLMHVAEVATCFETLHAEGKVKNFGVSNFSTDQLSVLSQACGQALLTNQIEFSPYNNSALDEGLFEQCQRFNIKPMLWSCLGGGRVAAPQSEADVRIHACLSQLVEKYQAATVEQIIYAWVLSLPCDPIILLGTSKLARIESAIASTHIVLEREDWYAVLEAARGAAIP